MQETSMQELIAHVARVEGQLASVRAALEANDCAKAARTLYAADRSLSSLRSTCVSEFLSRKVFKNAPIRDKKLFDEVRSLMRA